MAGCGKRVPEHLQIKPPEQERLAAIPITDLASALAVMVRKDPLARAPKLPDPAVLDPLEGTEPVSAYIRQILRLERGDGQVQRDLQELEEEFPETSVVALSRGYRLRVVENLIAKLEPGEESAESQILELITPLRASGNEETLPRRPLEWLVGAEPIPPVVRNVAERWVLTAWLRGPEIPVEVIGPQMKTPLYDGLSQTPTGKLVLARVSNASGPTEEGLEALRIATRLALTRAAADRDSEQADWSATKKEAAAKVGSDAPVAGYLKLALGPLTAGGGNETAAGGALVAIGASRWEDSCAIQPCIGLDRVETMRAAEAWGNIRCDAKAWQVIALKESLDTMDVGHDTVLFPRAMVDLADALIGTGAGPLEAQLLRRRTPDPAVWLALGRAVGTEAVTDWDGARVALGGHLEALAREAQDACDDSELEPLFERTIRRAVP